MPFLLWGVALFAAVMTVVAVVGYRHWVKPAVYLDRVGADRVDGLLLADDAERQPAVTRVLRRVGETVPSSPSSMRTMRRQLVAAGYRSEGAVPVMYGIQVASALAVGLMSAAIMTATRQVGPQMLIGSAILLGAGGYFLPNEILRMLIQRRRHILRHSLPDALDMLVVCVEAGLGLDQAILQVSEELRIPHRELSEELALTNLELRAGTRRSEALRNFAERTGEPDIKKLVSVLIQTDRFGTSIGEALRTHSDFMRVKRRQIAEEKANKIGVKLVFPIFFFILPAMFLVTAGPAVLQIMFDLLPMMRGLEQ